MCMVENADGWRVFRDDHPVAREPHRCGECHRTITSGERYYAASGVSQYIPRGESPRWERIRMCAHCEAAAQWLVEVCRGYVFGEVRDELCEHWNEGYASVPLGRLIGGMRYRWADGRMPIPVWAAELGRRDLAGSERAA